MNCDRFGRRLQKVLDDRLQPELDPLLANHADVCSECRDLLASYAALLRCVSPPLPQASTARQEVDHAAYSLPMRQPIRLATRHLPHAVAAVALLLLAIMLTLSTFDGQRFPQQVADQPADVAQVAVAPAGLPHPNEPYLVLARETGAIAEELASQQLIWVRPVAQGLKPVTYSMEAAWNAVRKTFPGGEAGYAPPSNSV